MTPQCTGRLGLSSEAACTLIIGKARVALQVKNCDEPVETMTYFDELGGFVSQELLCLFRGIRRHGCGPEVLALYLLVDFLAVD